MIQKTIIVLALVAITHQGFSQNKKDSITESKNELGVNLLPLTNFAFRSVSNVFYGYKDFRPTFNLQYKRKLKNNLYYRLGSDFTTNFGSNYSKYFESGVKMGLEYRWGGQKLKFFTGADLGYSYAGYKNIDNDLFYSERHIISLSTFIGLQYHFSKRFYFSSQVGIDAAWLMYKYNGTITPFVPYNQSFKGNNHSFGGNNRTPFVPTTNFSLFYKF